MADLQRASANLISRSCASSLLTHVPDPILLLWIVLRGGKRLDSYMHTVLILAQSIMKAAERVACGGTLVTSSLLMPISPQGKDLARLKGIVI